MATDFTYNGKTITTSGGIKPSGKNTPADIRTRVNTKADISSIPSPFVGMHIVVLQDETNSNKMTEYVVKSLKANSLGVADTAINEVVTLKEFLEVQGADFSDYYTKEQTDSKIAEEIAKAQLNGGGGVEDDVVDETYDIEINLPFVPTSNTKVQLEISNGIVETFNSETNPNINTLEAWNVLNNNAGDYVFEPATYLEKKCMHFSKDASTTGFATISSINPNSNKLDKNHKYYSRIDVCLISDGANSSHPSIYGARSFSNPLNKTLLNKWQKLSEIQTPTNSTNDANLRLMLDGEAYFTGVLIDLTVNNIETKTLAELDAMYEAGEFKLQTNPQFSCIIQNGTEQITVEPFNSNTTTKIVEVLAEDSLKITKNGDYPLAKVVAKISSANSDVKIEDVDFILNTRFRDKKAVFEGDSITSPTYASYYNGKSWASYVINKLKLSKDSLIPAQGGASITSLTVGNSVVERVLATNYPKDTKLFCVFAGTNDWGNNVALGEKTSMDKAEVLGALNTIIQTVQTKCPDADIVVMSPLHRYGDTTQHGGYTIYDMAKAYQEVCEMNGVTFVNSLTNFGIRNHGSINETYLLKDGLHPTEAGQKRIGVRMAGIISTL